MATPKEVITEALDYYEQMLLDKRAGYGHYPAPLSGGHWRCLECGAEAVSRSDIIHKWECLQGQDLLDIKRTRAHYGIEEE